MTARHDSIRIWRSPNARFVVSAPGTSYLQDETLVANALYTDAELSKIAGAGFNAIWVHGLLRHIVPSDVFPEFGKHARTHLKNLRALINRAAKHGIKLFIFMQPPRALPVGDVFWQNHPEAGGSTTRMALDAGKTYTLKALCTSTPPVRDYLFNSSASLAKSLPELGGVILITASECPSHCWARGGMMFDKKGHVSQQDINCPVCKERNPVDIVNEVIALVRDGIRSVSDQPEVITWNWSWTAYAKDPSPTIVNNLPKDVIYMAGFERGGTKTILGKRRPMDEYSLTFAGPSARFKKSTTVARRHGLRVMTKLQIGTTHELATVPNLPLIGNLYDKAKYLYNNDLAGFMGCWNFGTMLTANTAAFNYFLRRKEFKGKRIALENFASEYFPDCDATAVADAWLRFAWATDNYPFSMPFLYAGPTNYSLAYPLHPQPVGQRPAGVSWLEVKRRGDNLDSSFGDFSLNEIIKGLGQVHRQWLPAVKLFEKALGDVTEEPKIAELNVAWTCYHVFRSTWNTYRVHRLRRNWSDAKLTAYLKIVRNELKNLEAVLPFVDRDPRLGFHIEADAYMFNSKLIRKKISLLKGQRDRIEVVDVRA